MWAVRVRGRRFSGRQLSGLNFRLRDESSSVRDKNTLAGLCAKIVGGGGGAYGRGVYLQDTTVYMLYINHSKEVYMANILPETEVRGSLQ